MVIVEVKDGLGNQLFQYAVARAVAFRHSTDIYLNLRWYERSQFRKYRLDKFRTVVKKANFLQLLPYLPKVQNIIKALTGSFKSNYYRESPIRYDPRVNSLGENIYLTGLFFCDKYFAAAADQIRTDLQLKEPLPDHLAILRKQMANTESVSIHVRRGDYLMLEMHNYPLPIEYYARAISAIEDKIENPVYFLFSDDIEWATANLPLRTPAVLVSGRNTEDYQELALMSSCKHQVIANSTFSWWGAWLNANPEKIVVAPSAWFRAGSTWEPNDIVPDSWLKV